MFLPQSQWGKANGKFVEVYDTVLSAMEVAESTAISGMTGKEIDGLARNIIINAGFAFIGGPCANSTFKGGLTKFHLHWGPSPEGAWFSRVRWPSYRGAH